MWASHSTDTVECVVNIRYPVTQSIVHGIFQRTTTRGHRDNFSTQQAHTEYIWCLTLNIMRAHIDHTLKAKLCTDRRRCNAVLTSARFSDNALFSHAACQNDLAQHVVNFMRASVVQLVTLHVHFGTTKVFGQALSMIQWAWTANIVLPQKIHLCPKTVVRFRLFVFFLKAKDQWHQGFRDETSTEITKPSLLIRSSHKRIEKVVHLSAPLRFIRM